MKYLVEQLLNAGVDVAAFIRAQNDIFRPQNPAHCDWTAFRQHHPESYLKLESRLAEYVAITRFTVEPDQRPLVEWERAAFLYKFALEDDDLENYPEVVGWHKNNMIAAMQAVWPGKGYDTLHAEGLDWVTAHRFDMI